MNMEMQNTQRYDLKQSIYQFVFSYLYRRKWYIVGVIILLLQLYEVYNVRTINDKYIDS